MPDPVWKSHSLKFQSSVDRIGERVQFCLMKLLPLRSQHMIVDDINNHRCVSPLTGPESLYPLFNQRMRICKRINFPMKTDSFRNISFVQLIRISLHRVGNEIAQQNLVILRRKKNVA